MEAGIHCVAVKELNSSYSKYMGESILIIMHTHYGHTEIELLNSNPD